MLSNIGGKVLRVLEEQLGHGYYSDEIVLLPTSNKFSIQYSFSRIIESNNANVNEILKKTKRI